MNLVQKVSVGVGTLSTLGAVALGAQANQPIISTTAAKPAVTIQLQNMLSYGGEVYKILSDGSILSHDGQFNIIKRGDHYFKTKFKTTDVIKNIDGIDMPLGFNAIVQSALKQAHDASKQNRFALDYANFGGTFLVLDNNGVWNKQCIMGEQYNINKMVGFFWDKNKDGSFTSDTINAKTGEILKKGDIPLSFEFGTVLYDPIKKILYQADSKIPFKKQDIDPTVRKNLERVDEEWKDYEATHTKGKAVQPQNAQYDDTKIRKDFDDKIIEMNNIYSPILGQFKILTKRMGGLETAMMLDRFRIPSKESKPVINQYDDKPLTSRVKALEDKTFYTEAEWKIIVDQSVATAFNNYLLTQNGKGETGGKVESLIPPLDPNTADIIGGYGLTSNGGVYGGTESFGIPTPEPVKDDTLTLTPKQPAIAPEQSPTEPAQSTATSAPVGPTPNPNNADIIGGYGPTSNSGVYGGTESLGIAQPTNCHGTIIHKIKSGDSSCVKKENKGWYVGGRAGIFEENGAITGKVGIDGGYQFDNQISLSLGARLGLLHPERLVERYQGTVGASGRYAEGIVTNQDRTSIEGVLRFTYKPINVELFAGTELGNTKTNERIMRAGKVLAENNNSEAYSAFKYGISAGVMFPVRKNVELGLMGSYDNINKFSLGANVGFKLDLESNRE